MEKNKFKDFLKVAEFYKLKQVSRGNHNRYFCEKQNINYERMETTAEHIYSALRLADFFLSMEKEFSKLDRLKVYELIIYHDDVEIITGDVGISERDKRANKKLEEIKTLPEIIKKIPEILKGKLKGLDNEFREMKTSEAKFAKAIDRMDPMIQALPYPKDWGPKGFNEKNLRKWLQHSFEYSKTFMEYFEKLITYLDKEGYFEE